MSAGIPLTIGAATDGAPMLMRVLVEDGIGIVDHQGLWNGEPHLLLGFSAIADSTKVRLSLDEWAAEPEAALGLHPVFFARSGETLTLEHPVTYVDQREARA